ncbi:MAG TPA: MCE family protein [Pseudonocardiaceae bacterium]|jgi:phospholipid/cholesterol/gamma-HCH transport system substrate-binding protein|nr:MCE family protein [Pseudonocardiaceae bacterium]
MKSISERNPVAIGAVGIVVLIALVLLGYYADDLPFIAGGTSYTAAFTEAAGLRSGDDVLVAGVKVGTVTAVGLEGGHVKVSFRVKDTWVGDASTVAIKIKTLLGAKFLAVDPLGAAAQDPGQEIATGRTVSPYDVTEAFSGLATTVDQLDTKQLAQSFEAISGAFADTPPEVRSALTGLSALSQTISSRDTQLAQLLTNTKQLTGTLANDDSQFQTLLNDGSLLLGELRQREQAIDSLLTGTQTLAQQIAGLVNDDTATLRPALTELSDVTAVLQRNQTNLNQALSLAGPYYRLVGNAVGNGHWLDTYVCDLVPRSDLPTGVGVTSGCESPNTTGGK